MLFKNACDVYVKSVNVVLVPFHEPSSLREIVCVVSWDSFPLEVFVPFRGVWFVC